MNCKVCNKEITYPYTYSVGPQAVSENICVDCLLKRTVNERQHKFNARISLIIRGGNKNG